MFQFRLYFDTIALAMEIGKVILSVRNLLQLFNYLMSVLFKERDLVANDSEKED